MSPDFRRLWAAQAASAFAARVSREGLPIMAVIALGAEAASLGLLAALAGGAALATALFAGPLIDRSRRRPTLMGADLLRAAALTSIPLAAGLGVLGLAQVFAVAAVVAAAGTAFDMASHAYLPAVVRREDLVMGNARLSATDSLAEVGGPALAGLLFQWLSAPLAVAANALAYFASAAFIADLRGDEPRPEPGPAESWPGELGAGFRLVWDERRIRPLLAMEAAQGLFGGVFSALYALFAIRTLGLTPSQLGIAVAAGGAGALVGAALAPWLSRRAGHGPAIVLAMGAAALAVTITPLAPASPAGLIALVVSQVAGDAFATAGAILAASLRQALAPPQALGRMAGAFHAAGGAAAVVGALGGGALGALVGPRTALLIAAIGFLAPPLIGALSPLRDLRKIDAAD